MAVSKERDQTITRAALAAWIGRRSGSADVEVGEVSIPGMSGFSNETLLFDATWDDGSGRAQRGVVIRVEPSGHQVFPSTAFETQVRVLQALDAEGSIPVPSVLWFEEDTTVLGARFVAMERVEGEVPGDNPSYHQDGWVTALSPQQRATLWFDGIDTMAAIHRIDRSEAGLGWIDPVSPADLFKVDRAYRDFAMGSHEFAILDDAEAVLQSSIPDATAAPTLCWGDSRIGNMIFGPDNRVAAVLDWEMVTAGDPVQDLAWYLLLDRHHHEAFGIDRLPGFPDRPASIDRWERASGHSAEHLEWYELLGSYLYCSILTRVMLLLDSSGIMPGAAEMAFDHTGSQLLRRLLDERA